MLKIVIDTCSIVNGHNGVSIVSQDETMSKHIIRTDLLNAFLKRIAPIARKCHKKQIPYDYQELGKQYKEAEVNGIKKFVEFTEIELNINPCMNGWNIVAQIQRQDNGHNLITYCNEQFTSKYDKYIDSEIHCEHCNQNRRRKTAYILVNENENKTIIVGSTCLEEFTGGLDATLVAQCFESLTNLITVSNNSSDYSTLNSYDITSYSIDYILNIAFAVIKKQGEYVKNSRNDSTTNNVKEFLMGNPYVAEGSISEYSDKTQEYISWTRNYLNNKEELTLYERNLKTVCNTDRVCWSELAILCSLIPVYERNNKHEQENNIINEHYGELKQRITINVKNIKTHSFDSFYGSFYIHIITSDDGYTFVWKTSKWIKTRKTVYYKDGSYVDAEYIPSVIKGTISEHDEYNGVKQTVLKRCDVCEVTLQDVNGNVIDEHDCNIEQIA